MTHSFRVWLTLLPALLLSACATTPPPEKQDFSGNVWRLHADRVVSLDDWFLKGRIALRTEADSWSATLHWRQNADDFRLRVIAPLGQGTVELSGSYGSTITLVDSDNRRYTAENAESLMRERLGWSVPVEALAYWARGLPARGGGISAAEPDAEGRLRYLEQMGWQLEIAEYTEALGRSLPRKLTVNNDTVEVRLVVQSWEQPDDPGAPDA